METHHLLFRKSMKIFSFSVIKILTAEFVFQLKTGEQKQLDCPIQGSPEAVISWYKTNKKISGSKMLVIKLDNKDKFGNYTCVGENKAGKQTAVFSLQESSSNNSKYIWRFFQFHCSYLNFLRSHSLTLLC